ncbi:MAG: polysaccharide transporter, partial [Planctomycetota bacterium]|nr:polysaccharide transporter [Planctomycetota bacterium]
SSHLLKNIGWMLASEGVSRASRLITIIALAAFLTISEYGIAMLALACHELFRVFMRAGAGPNTGPCSYRGG